MKKRMNTLPHKQFLHTALCEENIARLNAGTWLSICDGPTNNMLFSVFLILLKHNPSAGLSNNAGGGGELWAESRLRYSLRNKTSSYESRP
jgi:hypothetical protein